MLQRQSPFGQTVRTSTDTGFRNWSLGLRGCNLGLEAPLRVHSSLLHVLEPPNGGICYWARRILKQQVLAIAESGILSFRDLPGRQLSAGSVVELSNGDFLVQSEHLPEGVLLYSLWRVSSGELELQFERRVRGVPLYSEAPPDLIPLLDVLEAMGILHRAVQRRTQHVREFDYEC